MPSSALRQRLLDSLHRRFFFGWAMLAVAILGMFASGPGQSHSFSVVIGPIGDELGLSGTMVASAYGLATLVAALCLPFAGKLVDRLGPRRMLVAVGLLLGLACIGFALAQGAVTLALGFAALRFLGQGALMLVCSYLVSQWFQARRGFALGLMALGFSASIAVHPPLAQALVDAVGWRQAWMWLGVMTWLLLLPPALVLVHDRPENHGLRPDGEAALAAGTPPPAIKGLTLAEALRTRAFYIVTAGLFTLSMLVTAMHFFQVRVLAAQGLEPQVAARLFSVSALTMVVAMPLFGRLLDRLPTERMLAAGQLVMAATLVTASQVAGMPSALAYAVMFGLANATTMTFAAYLWPHYFGRAHLGAVQGTGQMLVVVGASIGPIPFGLAYDHMGSFQPALLGSALLPVACAVLALFLRAPAMPERAPASALTRRSGDP
jgi:MFS family permease